MRWWKPEPDEPALMAWYEPLVAVARRARTDEFFAPVFIDEFEFFGRVERANRPTISVYGHVLTGQQLLADDEGRTYEFRPSASGTSPGRFREINLYSALVRSGVQSLRRPEQAHPAFPRGAAEPDGPPRLRLVRGGAA